MEYNTICYVLVPSPFCVVLLFAGCVAIATPRLLLLRNACIISCRAPRLPSERLLARGPPPRHSSQPIRLTATLNSAADRQREYPTQVRGRYVTLTPAQQTPLLGESVCPVLTDEFWWKKTARRFRGLPSSPVPRRRVGPLPMSSDTLRAVP